MRTSLWIILLILLASAIGWFVLAPSSSEPPALPSKLSALSPKLSALSPPPSALGSPLAARLNAPDGTPEEDVETLLQLLHQYQAQMHGHTPPIGDDIDLARALTGSNPLKRIILPANHPALSPDGHLRDRFGTPYFLHPRASDAFEVRSAGPDKKLFTADDIIANPGG